MKVGRREEGRESSNSSCLKTESPTQWGGNMSVIQYMRSQYNFWETGFFFNYMGSRDQNQVIGFGRQQVPLSTEPYYLSLLSFTDQYIKQPLNKCFP